MYINLKVHTDYTLLTGVGKVDAYLNKAKELNQKSIAITNTSLFDTIEYYEKAIKMDIKPIISLEVNNDIDTFNLYAKNIEGYKALIKLTSMGEKVDILDILKFKENIVVLNGGINSSIYKNIISNNYNEALKIVLDYMNKFDDFYLELPAFEMDEEFRNKYIKIIKESNVDFVITNDVYYVEKKDNYIQKIVLAIKENKNIDKVKGLFAPNDLYFKTYEEIKENLKNIDNDIFENGIKNINKIVDKCNVELEFGNKKLPIYLENINEKEYLRDLVYERLNKIGKGNDIKYLERVNYELSVIDKMGFNSYFLITQDIVKFARSSNILVGVGRGSAAGSLVSYLLDIIKIDPIKYNLIFERFLNPARSSMPDIDLDFEANKREEVIQYVMKRYKKEYVSNIVTFSTLKEKQIIRDLKRVTNYKMSPNITNHILNILLDNVRHSSIHASGVVISRDPLLEEIPVIYDKQNNINITQYNMKELEKLGLLKMDFLALANLDIISETIKEIGISLDDIDLNDKKAFELYNKGETIGLFQVESYGITELIKKFKINSIEDISAALALYRPGPLGSGMVDKVIARKNNLEKIEYEINDLSNILDDTYGIMIYQEQVMRIAQYIAGFSLQEADELRRAISKKIPSIIEKYKLEFINNSLKKGYEKKQIENLYSQIEAFGDYGFNKAHSISYGITSYYTAYLKANYTKEYLKALLNHKITDYSKLNLYFNELLKNNIDLLGVDINKSDVNFVVEGNNIRYAFYSINGISKNVAMDIVKERNINGEFLNINDFAYRMIKYSINKKHIEILADVGAFDNFNISRNEISKNSSEIYDIAKKKSELDENIGMTLFFTEDKEIEVYKNKNIEEYDNNAINLKEIELLGLPLKYFSSKFYKDLIKIFIFGKNISIGYVYSNKKIIADGVEYEINKNLNVLKYINKSCFIIKNKKEIISLYSFKMLNELKNISVEILLDNLTEIQKEYLKAIIKDNKGSTKINFYYKNKKLESNNFINLDIKFLLSIIKNIGENNLKIKITNLKSKNMI